MERVGNDVLPSRRLFDAPDAVYSGESTAAQGIRVSRWPCWQGLFAVESAT